MSKKNSFLDNVDFPQVYSTVFWMREFWHNLWYKSFDRGGFQELKSDKNISTANKMIQYLKNYPNIKY